MSSTIQSNTFISGVLLLKTSGISLFIAMGSNLSLLIHRRFLIFNQNEYENDIKSPKKYSQSDFLLLLL
jgi:hypothetical protein